SVSVPTAGGSLTEGETGPARFINPLLAISQADQDLTALVYSGLTREMPDGAIVPDLAQSYTVSGDGRTYTFHLRPNATFQDGSKLTAADVLFTIQEAQDPNINSAQRANWTGVIVSSPNAQTVIFTLPHAYAPFIDDTTMGILPKSLWQNVAAEEFPFSPLNTHPIGSGPYKVDSVSTDSTGSAARYDLVPFGNFALGTPFLSHISFAFFATQDDLVKALKAGKIDAAANLSPSDVNALSGQDLALAQVPLPRDFGVFFNQTHNPVLADAAVRSALQAATNKQALVAQEFSGRAAILTGPIPPGVLGSTGPLSPTPLYPTSSSTAKIATNSAFSNNARGILQNGGWTWNSATSQWSKGKETLGFTLATADQPELVATAKALAAQWQAAGIGVSVQVYPLAQLNTDVIRPRAYDALLFGEVVGPELDLYAFWHSSQRTDPGLNLAMYANSKTDALLSQARATTDADARDALYQTFATALVKDNPAVFLYAPDFLYVVPQTIHGIELGSLSAASDRFENVYQWYVDTKDVWQILAPAHPDNN
ncbi:MAG TPA: peptide ABC transporter substrate-binding protein, partial [Candidatus Paceibacterota bacterium]|nr:peptide ABC transporter substrate-binding protein [Candidatus Paceibacterota bacterium]